MKNSLTNKTLRDMKNYIKYTSLFLMIIGMGIGSQNTANATNAAGTYTLVKGANNSTYLETGQYVIGYVSTNMRGAPVFSGSGAQNLSGDLISSYMTGSYYALDEECILVLDGTEGVGEWTITNDGYDSYTIHDGTYYMCAGETKNKLIASTSATNASWSITHHKGVSYTACTVQNEAAVTYDMLANSGTTLSGYSGATSKIYFFQKTADLYDIHKVPDASGTASMDAKVGGISVTRAGEDATVVLSQTAKPNYRFDSWSVIDEDSHVITVTNNQFTMPAAEVWVYPQYTACATDATVTAASSESVSQTTATIRCTGGISSKGDSWCAITEYGFVISEKATNATPAIGGTGVTKHQIGTDYPTLSTGFSKALTGLTASTTYCVRAYAINGHGTAYSAVHEFTTTAETQYGNYVITCDDYHTVTYNQNTEDSYTGTLPTDNNTYAAGQTVYVSDGTIGRTGYDFVGWNTNPAATTAITEFTMGSSNVTIYAIWSPIDYTLTMATNLNTATSNAAITSPRAGAGDVADKHYGESITVTVVAPPHHTFVNWTCSAGTLANASATSTTFTMPAGNATVTANFTEDTKYTVTWSDNGSTDLEQVYSGETTSFPSLADDCSMYVATGWVQDNSNTFTSETTTKPGTIYAVGATTPAVTGNVTYKAVYRHKYYTDADFVNGTTDGKGYYLYATTSGGDSYYKTTFASANYGFVTSTTKNNAVPVYLEAVGGSYYMRDVASDKYYYGNSGSLAASDDKSATDAYKWTFSTPSCDPTKGDYKIVNEGDKATKTFLFNSGSGTYMKEYANSNNCASAYYNFYLEPAYYYKYSPTAACYDIVVSSNAWANGTFQTLTGSSPKYLVGNELKVTPKCGYHISSVNISGGTYTSSTSGRTTTYIITPSAACTFTVNFTTAQSDADKNTISFLDGATTMPQTKTDPQYECGSYSLPNGYSTAEGDGGACTGWTFDGWTATNYVYGQMSAPSDIQAAGSSQTATGDATWYAVYHKTFAAGDFFNIKYGNNYIADYGSHQFTTTTNSADALQFNVEDNYLYYIDKVTRAKKWVYYVTGTNQNVTTDDAKPSSNYYKTTFTDNGGGTYIISCNSKYLAVSSDKIKFLTTSSAATKPNASSFTAYYPKTDCTIENVTITFDAGPGNTFTSNSSQTYPIMTESGSTITLPIEADLSYDNTSWTFIGWSSSTISGVAAGAPSDLIVGGGSYTVTESITLHAVYSQTPPDGNFENKGGRYVIWSTVGGVNYYAKSHNQVKGKLEYTEACAQASIFELVETGIAGQYKIHIVGEAKYLGGEGCADANTDFIYTNANVAPVWTITQNASDTYGKWRVVTECGNRGFVCMHSGDIKFGHYSTSQVGLGTYFDVNIGQCDDYYTTNPNKTLSVTGDVKVTSSNGRMVMAKNQLVVYGTNLTPNATLTVTSNSSDVYFSTTREVNIVKASKPETSISFNANDAGDISQPVYVHYMPSVSTHGIENVLVTVTSPDKSVENTIKVRHMPATFAICAKVGTAWYALTGNMKGATNPKAIQIEVNESSWTAYAPDTCAYQLWPVKTTDKSGDRYTTQGEKVRFSAVNNTTTTNAGLWANNSSTANTINDYAAITAISSDPAEQYEWKITATEVGSTWKYTLQMDQGTGVNNNYLNIHRDANLVWGTYSEAVTNELYLLPISEITPFEFSVIEWYPTKVLIQTENAVSSPTIKVNGVTDADASCTAKGSKWFEIGNLSLTSNATKLLSISYTSGPTTYKGIKTIPIIISRTDLELVDSEADAVGGYKPLNEPFASLTKEIYSYADLVVRDGATLTINGTSPENTFYDVTVYPTSKISVPENNANGANNFFNVHSFTFFGGIDDIYNGSAYSTNKYGVPELSLKGKFGTKTVTTIDYVMRVDATQMYSLTVPYDVDLADITFWDGSSMGTLGSNLWVSAYDGQARANKEMANTWIWEVNFASKGLAAKLKQGVGYTISANKQFTGNPYTIIRMPMKSNVAANATEVAKTVPVTAHGKDAEVSANHKGWNLVGNPYMVSINGGEPGSQLVVGYLTEHKQGEGEEAKWDGTYDWKNDTYRYVTIPFDDGTDYYQQKFSDATLPPFKNFFVQIGESGDLSFALTSRQNSPARFLQVKEREVEFEVLLANESRKDNMGLLIADQYSTDYEINADLEKMIGTMSVYTILGGYNLAYNALSPDDAKEWIPVGYVAPTAGEYTFSLDENSDMTEVEHVYLTDYLLTKTVDLVEKSYTFSTETGKNEARFAINVVLKPEPVDPITTGVNHLDSDSDVPTKFIYQDKMYILYHGIIYDAVGKKVKEINK